MAIKYQWHLEYIIMYEKFGVIITRKSKTDRQYNGQQIKDKKIKKTLHRKLKIDQHEPHKNRGWTNTGDPEGLAVPAPLVSSVVLPLNDTNIIWKRNRIGHQYT
jgi:hypothetical protein